VTTFCHYANRALEFTFFITTPPLAFADYRNVLTPESCTPAPQQDGSCKFEYQVTWSQENDYLLLIKEYNEEEGNFVLE